MGEHQCPHCGHITTGFEQQQFEVDRAAVDAKDAEIARLRAALTRIRDNCHGAVEVVATVNGAIGLPPLQTTKS